MKKEEAVAKLKEIINHLEEMKETCETDLDEYVLQQAINSLENLGVAWS